MCDHKAGTIPRMCDHKARIIPRRRRSPFKCIVVTLGLLGIARRIQEYARAPLRKSRQHFPSKVLAWFEFPLLSCLVALAFKCLTVSKAKQQGIKSSSICVRNIAFEATRKELYQLFGAYGTVTSCRLPKKSDYSGHRGFAFIDFASRGEAAAAFEALQHSHLYGRARQRGEEAPQAGVKKGAKAAQEEKGLSMGYGFLEFETTAQAAEVLKRKQGAMIDGHAVQLQISQSFGRSSWTAGSVGASGSQTARCDEGM
eukprot:s7962_g1.t1